MLSFSALWTVFSGYSSCGGLNKTCPHGLTYLNVDSLADSLGRISRCGLVGGDGCVTDVLKPQNPP